MKRKTKGIIITRELCPVHNMSMNREGWYYICPVDKRKYTKDFEGKLIEVNNKTIGA